MGYRAASMAASKQCDNDAKAKFKQAGGTEADFKKEEKKGEQTAVTNTFKDCIGEKMAQFSQLTGKDRILQIQQSQKECNEQAKIALADSGGDEKEFNKIKEKAAVTELATSLENCVKEKQGTQTNTTAIVLRKYQKECDATAELKYANAGGNVKKYQEAKKKAAETAIRAKSTSCMEKATASQSGLSSKSESEKLQIYKTARESCKKTRETAFTMSGGSTDKLDFQKAEEEADAKELSDELQACVEESQEYVAVENSTLSLTKKEKEQRLAKAEFACNNRAKEFLIKRGVNPNKLAEIKNRAVKTCTDEKCKGEKYATAAEPCNDDCKKSFVEAGGNAEEFEVEKRKAQKTKIKNTMATCIKSRSVSRDTFNTALETCMASELSGKTGGKEKYEARIKCYKSTSVQTELKKLQVSYRSARTVCSNSTKTSYLKVGGKSDKFVREKKKAAVSELKTALKSCVEEKMLEKNVTSLSKELRMEIITDCRSYAEEEFQSAGGKPEQFQEAQKKQHGSN